MSGARRAAAVARKDLLIEWRGREITTAMGTFAVLVILLLGFALGSEPARAPAILWVALTLAAMLGVARPTQMELDQGAFETLLLYPGSREHVFWGKWAALTVLLAGLLGFLLLLLGILFNVDIWHQVPALLGAGLLGIIGLASIGTLFAALVIHVRGRELLMPLLLLPIAVPVILAGIRLTEAILTNGPGGVWVGVLLVFDILFSLVAPIFYEVVMEEI